MCQRQVTQGKKITQGHEYQEVVILETVCYIQALQEVVIILGVILETVCYIERSICILQIPI